MRQAVLRFSNYNNQICNIHNERQICELCGSALGLKGTCFLWPQEQEAGGVGGRGGNHGGKQRFSESFLNVFSG